MADRVDEVLQQHLTPVVIGGDCTITLGVLAGYLRHVENLGLVYFDGDIDLTTPATTHSGIFDSMGMAHMIGEGADALSHIGSRIPLMPEDHIVLFVLIRLRSNTGNGRPWNSARWCVSRSRASMVSQQRWRGTL